MSVTKVLGHQHVMTAEIAFTYADLGAAVVASLGALQDAYSLPANARVVGGELVVDTAWVGPTAATLDIGDAADPDRYSATPIDLKTAGRTALTLTGFKTTSPTGVQLDPVLTVAAATAGAAWLRVQYVVQGKSDLVQE